MRRILPAVAAAGVAVLASGLLAVSHASGDTPVHQSPGHVFVYPNSDVQVFVYNPTSSSIKVTSKLVDATGSWVQESPQTITVPKGGTTLFYWTCEDVLNCGATIDLASPSGKTVFSMRYLDDGRNQITMGAGDMKKF